MEKFTQEAGSLIIDRLILAIQENKQYLSDIDGAIGDGDHGINMNKGFTLCREALDKQNGDFTYGLKTLGKTLMDVLIPADEAYAAAAAEGRSFAEALDAMDAAALKGRDSTVDMVAKLGRSSRLGERSRGVMDAGSASCYLILHTMADTVKELLAA